MSIINIKDFPDDLHRRAKSEAALEGISLKAIIIKALEEYLKKKKKGGKWWQRLQKDEVDMSWIIMTTKAKDTDRLEKGIQQKKGQREIKGNRGPTFQGVIHSRNEDPDI